VREEPRGKRRNGARRKRFEDATLMARPKLTIKAAKPDV